MSVARADRLAALAAEEGLDALLVTGMVNLRWLTGFTGTSGLAVVGGGIRAFVTDFRYVEQAADQAADFAQHRCERELADALPAVLDGRVRIGFDDAHLSVKGHRDLVERLPGAELVSAGGLVERLRVVKDPAEIEAIRAAAALADAAFEATLAAGLVGRTERAVALALEDEMRRRGAQRPSFDSIVASGPHGALPHAVPRDEPIPAGSLVVIDWGAELDGYCSDCTRTVAAGEVDAAAAEVYGIVLDAQEAAVAAVAPGAGGREVDGVARDVIAAAGHGDAFGHGLGHGVGLEVHEAPRLSKASEATLAAGNVVTVEPGVYLPGRFGVRIEDLVAVTADGADILSSLPKALRTIV